MSALTLDQKLDLIEASGIVGWKLVWDRCHKIYILTRPEQGLELRLAGFNPDTDVYPAGKIRELWDKSCGLRFVHLWDLTLDVPWNISQFEGEEDEEDSFEYVHTHRSVNDGSPAMKVGDALILVNEDGDRWTDPADQWEPIDE